MLGDSQVLDLWERARTWPMALRATALLGAIHLERPVDQWALDSVGERDAALLRWHARVMGQLLPCIQACPACGSMSEFELDVDSLLEQAPSGVGQSLREWRQGGFRMEYKVPNSMDVCRFGEATDEARRQFVEDCVVAAECSDNPSDPLLWPEATWVDIESDLLLADPLAEIRLGMSCPACGQNWDTVLDVASYMWSHVARRAGEIVDQVHALARGYGWSERQILEMNSSRRDLYLQRLAAAG